MAVHKANRSLHLAQPKRLRLNNPGSTELQHVKTRVYRAMADINSGFDLVLQGLQILSSVSFLHFSLRGMHNLVARLRAKANHELTAILSGREKANATHFQRLCLTPDTENR
jgi:hypothetical protein